MKPGVTWMKEDEVARACQLALANGAAVFEFKSGPATTAGLFEAIRGSLPLDPPVIGSSSWDALSDSLWGGLDSLDQREVVLAWLGASEFKTVAPAEFEIAADILRTVAEGLGSWEATYGEPKRVTVLLA